jgi:acetyltransferase-like isoleucine patch superfamily enzyme
MARIEDDVAIGSNVDLLSGRRQHGFAELDRPIQSQPKEFRQVRVGRNAWVGNSCVIMADVAEDAVVGAGSVVVKPVPAGAVAAGNPAAVKKWRYAGPRQDARDPERAAAV